MADLTRSVNSIDGILDGGEEEASSSVNWTDELTSRIERILDRKKSGVHGREEDLAVYVHILRAHYSHSHISSQLSSLLSAFLKSMKSEVSERETILAITAVAISTLTHPTEDGAAYELCSAPITAMISSSESVMVKIEAIHALGAVAFYSGGSLDETEETMSFLLEIVESDGNNIGADDNGPVVTAALEVWGFLATQLEDMEQSSSTAMDTLVEQLESADSRVQIASGEDIALLYEKSYTDIESDEELSDPELDPDALSPTMIQRYEPYRRKDQLIHALSTIAKVSSKSVSKKDRKSLHTNFADITKSVENPTLGPRYSSAIDDETDKHYGSRMHVKVSKNASMRIDKWWKLHRLRALRRVLQGGFLEHYQSNEVVLDTLPVLTS